MERCNSLTALLGLSALACADGPASSPHTTTRVMEIPTPSLGSLAGVRVQVEQPPGIPEAAIVFLHGVGGSDQTWAELAGPESLSGLAGAGGRHVLMVAVAGDSLGWPDRLDGTVSWERFLMDDLPAFLRATYGPQLTGHRIAYLGTSAGGEKALTMAFRHPGALACVAAHSPALHPADPRRLPGWAREWEGWRPLYGLPINDEAWRAGNAIHLAATVPAGDLDDLSLYFDAGVDDHLGFQETSAALSAELARRRIPHEFALRPGGHGSAFTRANLPNSLGFLLRCLRERADSLRASGQP